MEHEGWSFLCGCAPEVGFAFFARERDDVAERDITITTFYVWDQEDSDPEKQWTIYNDAAKWRARSMATIKPPSEERTVVTLGTRGQYFELHPASLTAFLGKITGADRLVRRLTAIDDVFFAAGMGRSVIRRLRRGEWQEFGPGVTPEDNGRVVGFEGIDGFSKDDIYVAGWGGELWRWFNGSWQRIDNSTNANLNAIACDRRSGLVYAVGDNGSVVRGSGDSWVVVETGRPENLQDVVIYDGEVFVVSDFDIVRLTESGLVPETRFIDGDRPATCLHLMVARDGVISMGPKDLFAFSDGTWRRIV